jgi:hypothetical protein
LQHQAVAAESDDDIGVRRVMVAVSRNQPRQRLLRFRAGARDKGNPLIWPGRGHEIVKPFRGWLLVYTTLAVVVETINSRAIAVFD